MEPHKLLIVDDEKPVRTIVRTALGDDDFVFSEAGDGEEAWKMILVDAPDLVLCDYEMPGMNGFELLKRLQGDQRLRHLPVIILTGHARFELALEGLEAGAQDYLIKPFEPDDLRIRVLAQMRKRDRNRAHTSLPSGLAIPQELERRIGAKSPFAAIYAWLKDFDAYIYKFGFRWAASAIRRTSALLEASVRTKGAGSDFVAHVTAENFLLISAPERVEELCKDFLTRFQRSLPELYDEKDIERGVVLAADRQGFPQRYSLMSPAFCIVDSSKHELAAAHDVAKLAASARARGAGSGEAFLYA